MGTSPSKAAPARKPAAILFVAAFAAFLATFNETFLNVGFAPIMESLSVDVSTVQWLATAYMGIMSAMTTLGPSSSVILAGVINGSSIEKRP